MINITENTKQKLIDYQNILIKWQKKINLIADSTVNNIWERHILDCLQLAEYITCENKTIVDLGSGAGLPGMVLAINNETNNYYLIEANSKKIAFLNEIKQQLNLNNVTVIGDRIENIYNTIIADYVVSRALTNLTNLLEYSQNILKPHGKNIFLKGKTFAEEIDAAKKNTNLNLADIQILDNKINNQGKIIIITKV